MAWVRRPSYGTTVSALPSNPIDGQEIFFQASGAGTGGNTNTMITIGFVWKLRYNAASSSSYKWEFVGGQPVYYEEVANVSVGTDGVWRETTSRKIVVPLAGDYLIGIGAQLRPNPSGDSTSTCAFTINASGVSPGTPSGADGVSVNKDQTGIDRVTKIRYKTALTANSDIRTWFWGNGSNASTNSTNSYLSLQPIRVG